MIDKKRFSIRIGGESGQGINVTGEILAKALKNSGYKVFAYREYPSLIRGGVASYQLDFSNVVINSSSRYCNILACVSRTAIHTYLRDIAPNGVLYHSISAVLFDKDEQEFIDKNNISVRYIDAFTMAINIGGNRLFSNIIMAGLIWKCIGLSYREIRKVVVDEFKDKPKLLEKDLDALRAGYDLEEECSTRLSFSTNKDWADSVLLSGNEAIAVGALVAGVRACYTYPMTPATSIHAFLSKTYHETGVLMKEAEDEITAIQLTIGSMFAGTRAFVATSGGGFDLMAESTSLIGISETPVVIVMAQRAGAATGVPTWTGQADLNQVIHIGHGEFPRIVMAASDATSAYEMIQRAYNFAEQFQTLVVLLTEKQIAESLFNLKKLSTPIPIKRYLLSKEELKTVKPEDRYKFTATGVSPRWLPGQCDSDFLATSDEHAPDGASIEDAEGVKNMVDKRNRKFDSILVALPEPKLHGPDDAKVTFIGWGSTKSTMLDVVNLLKKTDKRINYLHFDYLYPLRTDFLKQVVKKNRKVVVIEGNSTGQLHQLIKREAGIDVKEKLLKYDGRPFFVEDVLDYLKVKY